MVLACVAALVGALATAGSASAAGNATSGVGSSVACAFGSCFAPQFNAVGETDEYTGPAAAVAEFADCCIAGDTYKVTAKNKKVKASITFTSEGTLEAGCGTGPYPDAPAFLIPGGFTAVKYKAVKLPGGVPAAAYIRMSAGGWTQTKGVDSCGF
jgi:hypothetical protein